LYLRVRAKQSKVTRSWLFRYAWRSSPTWLAIGSTPTVGLADARAKAQEYIGLIKRGIDPRRAANRSHAAPRVSASTDSDEDRHSIETLAREYLDLHVTPSRKRPEYVRKMLDKDVLSRWRGRDARTIKPREVIDLLDEIVARGSPVAANRTATVLGQMFKYGIHRTIIETSPVQLLYRPGGKEKPRQRALSDAELATFLKDPKGATRFERLAHVIAILLLTGQRRGELVAAKWSDIDFDAQTWGIPAENSKTGRDHVVPLTDWAVREFEALHRLADRSMWVLPAIDIKHHVDAKLLTRAVAKCLARFKQRGIAAFTLHDLRRTCRTGLARLKVEPHIAERVLGHAQEKIVAAYDVHHYLGEKRAALEAWAKHLATLLPLAGPKTLISSKSASH
jgi:integrase